MTSFKQLEVHTEDPTQQKWCVPLKEDVFATYMAKGGPMVRKVFGNGSLFSPLLFGKFFDPSDAFPLWDFESDILLSNLRRSGQSTVDWFQTDTEYVLKAELPGLEKNSDQGSEKQNDHIFVEKGKVIDISGRWRQQREFKTKDWRKGNWWEHGYVRRLELPENADWKRTEARVNNDILLEIRIPKNPSDLYIPQGNEGAVKEFESA